MTCDGPYVRDRNGRCVCERCGSASQRDLFAYIAFGDRVFEQDGGGLFIRHRDGTSVFRDAHFNDEGRERLLELKGVMVL